MTAEQIAQLIDQPVWKVEKALESLESKGLIIKYKEEWLKSAEKAT